MRLIHAHDKATPFFMYFALHNTHSPFQAPHRFQVRRSMHPKTEKMGV